MNEEERKAFLASIQDSMKAIVEPIQKDLEAVKAKVEEQKKDPEPEPAAKSQPDTADIEKIVSAAVSKALDARDGKDGKDDKDSGLKAEEIESMIGDKINEALKNLSSGLKSKQDGDKDAPGAGDDKEPELAKALKAIQSGEKTIDDFDEVTQRKLEDFSAKAFEQIESSWPQTAMK